MNRSRNINDDVTLAYLLNKLLDKVKALFVTKKDADAKYVYKAGDTITGMLYIKNALTDGTPPSSDTWAEGVALRDSGNATIGGLRPVFLRNGKQGVQLSTNRVIGGASRENHLGLFVDANNNATVDINRPDAWLSALGFTVTKETTISNIAAATSGCTISEAQYAIYGGMAQIRLKIRKTAAVSSGITTVATIVSGKRPVYGIGGAVLWASNKTVYINDNGTVQVGGAISANEDMYITATYILA